MILGAGVDRDCTEIASCRLAVCLHCDAGPALDRWQRQLQFRQGWNLSEVGGGIHPTLTLPEAGGASLVGKLTADLPSWGTGLQIDNGSLTTTIGAQNSGLFHFNTGLPQFYFNKNITVDGDIRSYNTDTILGPSNNTDTYLRIAAAVTRLMARADQFLVQGDSKYLQVKFTSTAAELRSDASKFYMNKPLEVEWRLDRFRFDLERLDRANRA